MTVTRGLNTLLAPQSTAPVDIFSMHRLYTGVPVPDPITFIIGPEWCNRPNIYPRQATLIKVIFLRNDLLTEYDHQVIDEWEEQYVNENGLGGLAPGVREKMRFLRALGHKWFREVLLIMGRRAGKGHVTALCMAYVLWNYMAKGDPQKHYGVDRDKKLVALIFAGKRDQAKATVYGDLASVITGSECFLPYVSQDLAEKLSIFAPSDFVRMQKRAARGIKTGRDPATFVIQPRESTVMAGRGPTSMMQAYDEAAHIVASGANRSAQEVYDAAKPSLDQFGKDAFLCHPSSPWQMLGMFYDNWLRANEKEHGEFVYPDMLSIQLASWEIYYDWERTQDKAGMQIFPEGFLGDLNEYESKALPTFQPLNGAIQVYDDQMKREERANPDTFKVERKSKWAASLDAYLNETKVVSIFKPWQGRPEKYGPPVLTRQVRGIMAHTYKGHADPSKVNDKFGVVVGHPEYDDEGKPHVVVDLVHHFDPQDFPDNIIDYATVDEWIWENAIKAFVPGEFTFDQYNSTSSIQHLQRKIRAEKLPKRVEVFEKTVTRQNDWEVKENTKAAVNMGLVHCYSSEDDIHAERLELELKFLQLVNGRVDHPSSGPVQSKDLADCLCEVVNELIGEQINNFLHNDLSNFRPDGALQGGIEPFGSMSGSREQDERMSALSSFGRARGRSEYTPSQNARRRRR